MIFDKKMAMLYILDILKEYSDENHPLTQKDIIDKLHNIRMIDIERKTIASTIELLTKYGYDVISVPKKGYYLYSRDFDETEIKYLVDAIYSSKTIPGVVAKKLSKKLYSSLSKYAQKDYAYLYKSTEINRAQNNDVFLNIELINEAIKQKKKITFQYLIYDEKGKLTKRWDGYKYKVSPYFLINNFNKYYLLCNVNTHPNHANYRIEYMTNIEVLDEEITPYKDIESMGEKFDISKYINDHIYMFGGELINAKIEILNKNAITYVIDWFGENARVYNEDGKIFATIKSNDDAFFYWALQYQDHIKVLSPEKIVNRIVSSLEENIKKYK